jgi:hypothetical protein
VVFFDHMTRRKHWVCIIIAYVPLN